MRSTRSEGFAGTIQAGKGAPVECAVRRGGAMPTRRQLVVGGLAMAVAAGASSSVRAAPLVVRSIRVDVSNIADYRSGLARLVSRYKTALVDVGAEWCEVCSIINQRILPDPEVQRALEYVALVGVDVTQTNRTTRELLQYLHADGPPTVFIVDTANGREFAGTRSVGSFTAADLLRRLRPFAPA